MLFCVWWRVFCQYDISVLKSGMLKYSDIFIKWEWKLLLPLQYKSNDFKKDCLTKDSSSLGLMYKM